MVLPLTVSQETHPSKFKFGRSFMVTGFTTTFITAQDPMEFEGFMLAYS